VGCGREFNSYYQYIHRC